MSETPRGETQPRERGRIPEREAEKLVTQIGTLSRELDGILNPRQPNSSEIWGYDANEIEHPFSPEVSHWDAYDNSVEWLRDREARLDRLRKLFDGKTQEISEAIDALAQLVKDAREKLEQE